MDPVTQGAFGAIFAQTMSNKKKILVGSIVGCLAGLAPDLDIFIRSASDPLLKLEYPNAIKAESQFHWAGYSFVFVGKV